MGDDEVYINGRPLKSLKVAELKEACKLRNLPHNGNKATVAKRLKAAIQLENLQKAARSSEGAVQPNSDIADNTGENDFVKQYLENQRKMLQKQHHRFSSASEAESEEDAPRKLRARMNTSTEYSTEGDGSSQDTDESKGTIETDAKPFITEPALEKKEAEKKPVSNEKDNTTTTDGINKNGELMVEQIIQGSEVSDDGKEAPVKEEEEEEEKQDVKDQTDEEPPKMEESQENKTDVEEPKQVKEEPKQVEEEPKQVEEEPNEQEVKKDVIAPPVVKEEKQDEEVQKDQKTDDKEVEQEISPPTKEANDSVEMQESKRGKVEVVQDDNAAEKSSQEQESTAEDQTQKEMKTQEKDAEKKTDDKIPEESINEEDKDVEGVPVITMETDVLIEEVEELDYDEGESVADKNDDSKRSKHDSKKKKKHRRSSSAKDDKEDLESPEAKKKKKIKRSSTDDHQVSDDLKNTDALENQATDAKPEPLTTRLAAKLPKKSQHSANIPCYDTPSGG